jgi:hypothetical protein
LPVKWSVLDCMQCSVGLLLCRNTNDSSETDRHGVVVTDSGAEVFRFETQRGGSSGIFVFFRNFPRSKILKYLN